MKVFPSRERKEKGGRRGVMETKGREQRRRGGGGAYPESSDGRVK